MALSKPVLSHCAWAYCCHTSCQAKATHLSSTLMLLFNKSSFRDSNIACQHWCTYYFGGACASSAIHSIRKLHCALSLKPQDIPGDMGSAHCFFCCFCFLRSKKDSLSNVNLHAICKCLPFHMHRTMYDRSFTQFLWSRR